MVEIVRRKNINFTTPDVKSAGMALASSVKKVGATIENIGKEIQSKQQAKEKKYQAEVQQNIKTAQQRMVSEQKAYDAADKMVATDMAGRLKNDLLRWNLEQRQNNPNYIGTAEHEKRMRDEYARLSNVYGQGLGEAGRAEFQSKTQSAVNEFIGNDVKWAYQQKIKKGEESAKSIAETMNKTAGMYGANGDVEGFKEAHEENRKSLEEYAETSMPAGAGKALNELDIKSINQFLSGLAQTDPERAKAIMDSMENFKELVSDKTLQDMSNQKRMADRQRLSDEVIIINAGIANSKDKKEQKKLTKMRDARKKELDKIGDKDYEAESLAELHKQVSESVGKEIDYQLNLHKQEQERAIAAQKTENALSFLDNPIIYKANMDRISSKLPLYTKNEEINKKLEEKANEIYSLSDKIGDGQLDPTTLQLLVTKVASITVDDKNPSIVDDNILKAYDANIALRKAGADSDQITLFNQLTEKAMTDTNFKQSVAALANKPNFDTMFLSGRKPGLPFSYKTADTMYVEKKGREAYIGAIGIILSAQTPEELPEAKAKAMAYYDKMVADTYDYIKRDVIDVDYVKRELAKSGSAMVELNGNMTKIVGRLPNGEYIIEDTGEKINGGI